MCYSKVNICLLVFTSVKKWCLCYTDGLCPAMLDTCHKLGMRTVISVETPFVLSIKELFLRWVLVSKAVNFHELFFILFYFLLLGL